MKPLVGFIASFLLVFSAQAQIQVDYMAFSTAIEQRKPSDARTSFTNEAENVFCFSRIVNADGPTFIYHVWSFAGEEKFRISLSVRDKSWRTWSTRTTERLLSQGAGTWRVDVMLQDGQILESKEFVIHAVNTDR